MEYPVPSVDFEVESFLFDDVLLSIFEFLPPRELFRMGFVSRRFRLLASHRFLWQPLLDRQALLHRVKPRPDDEMNEAPDLPPIFLTMNDIPFPSGSNYSSISRSFLSLLSDLEPNENSLDSQPNPRIEWILRQLMPLHLRDYLVLQQRSMVLVSTCPLDDVDELFDDEYWPWKSLPFGSHVQWLFSHLYSIVLCCIPFAFFSLVSFLGALLFVIYIFDPSHHVEFLLVAYYVFAPASFVLVGLPLLLSCVIDQFCCGRMMSAREGGIGSRMAEFMPEGSLDLSMREGVTYSVAIDSLPRNAMVSSVALPLCQVFLGCVCLVPALMIAINIGLEGGYWASFGFLFGLFLLLLGLFGMIWLEHRTHNPEYWPCNGGCTVKNNFGGFVAMFFGIWLAVSLIVTFVLRRHLESLTLYDGFEIALSVIFFLLIVASILTAAIYTAFRFKDCCRWTRPIQPGQLSCALLGLLVPIVFGCFLPCILLSGGLYFVLAPLPWMW